MTFDPESSFKNYAEQVARALPRLQTRIEMIERLTSPRMNPFLVLQVNENAVNRFIADLLNPYGAHGQGALFLEKFLTMIGLGDTNLLTHSFVRTEAPTYKDRRVDILVAGKDWIVGIENKFDAIQQSNQLDHYWDDLVKKSKKTRLVFLSDQVPNHSDRTELTQITYSKIDGFQNFPEMLADLLSEIESERTKQIVQYFIEYIDNNRRQASMANTFDSEYAQYLSTPWTDNSGSISEEDGRKAKGVAMATLLGVGQFQKLCIEKIESSIRAKMEPLGVSVDPQQNLSYQFLYECVKDGDNIWKLRNPSWPEHCCLAISSRKPFEKIDFGIYAPEHDDNNNRFKRIHNRCQKRIEISHFLNEKNFHADIDNEYWAYAEEVYGEFSSWTPAPLARMIIESDSGDISAHYAVENFINRLVLLAASMNEGFVVARS